MVNDGMPVRIQRQRRKGWRMPENTVYVGRPSKWGNPFEVGEIVSLSMAMRSGLHPSCIVRDRAAAVEFFRKTLMQDAAKYDSTVDCIIELRGKNLACWCPLDQPCHADVLLELANKA